MVVSLVSITNRRGKSQEFLKAKTAKALVVWWPGVKGESWMGLMDDCQVLVINGTWGMAIDKLKSHHPCLLIEQ